MTLLEMYESGMSTSQIAQKLGINPTTVRSRMKKEGIKLRSPGGTCTFNVDEAIQLCELLLPKGRGFLLQYWFW